jgi:hypothetical protein
MKSLSIFMALGAAVVFSGCSNAMMEAAGEDYLHANGYDDKSTYFCYDWLDKQECPTGLLQVDLDVFSFVPGTSRFCFGFTETNTVVPVGMVCVYRNFIPDSGELE